MLNRQPHILYADENEDARLMLSALLKFSNIEVQVAKSFEEAIEFAGKRQFDLYLLDTRFQDNNGLELCRKLKEIDSQTPVVFYSCDGYEINKYKGLEAGADAYLVKPHFDEIPHTVFRLVN
jgi:two-component system alkaline phosphatase synthesis response regulator PhoP